MENDITEFLDTGGESACEVTGLTAATEEIVAARPKVVWAWSQTSPGVSGWSQECIRAPWLAEPGRPRPGARFTGQDRLPNGFEYEVTCVITEADQPRAFAWVILDDSGDPSRPRRGDTGSTRPPAAAGSGSEPSSGSSGRSRARRTT